MARSPPRRGILRGIAAGLDATGLQSGVGVSDDDAGREEALLASMLAWRPAAVLVAGLEQSERARDMLAGGGTRVAEMLRPAVVN